MIQQSNDVIGHIRERIRWGRQITLFNDLHQVRFAITLKALGKPRVPVIESDDTIPILNKCANKRISPIGMLDPGSHDEKDRASVFLSHILV